MPNCRNLLLFVHLLLTSFVCASEPPHSALDALNEEDLYENAEPEFASLLSTKHQDDLFEMLERGTIRVLVSYSKTHYFVEDGKQHGLNYEMLKAFEDYLKKRYRSRIKGRSMKVIPIPVARDQHLSKLREGYGDLAVANLTITPERKQVVDFSIPVFKNIDEIVVASSTAPALTSIEDLSGKTVYVRTSSSFHEHLKKLNQNFSSRGLQTIHLVEVDEHLEVEDLMEMANANLIQYTIVDNHIARLWSQIFKNIVVYDDLSINSGGQIAWAVRKTTPNLMFEVNRFLKRHRSGTLFGNVLKNRYLKDPYWAKTALAENGRKRYNDVIGVFKKYSEIYDFNHLMVIAQAYQESELDHTRKSPVGAIGIMQLMPKTGAAMDVGDISKLENNVHGGIKYLKRINEHYFNDEELDELNRMLFSFAAYNAGPTRIRKLRRITARYGLNPNVWYGNVEHTVARHIGRETVTYVANISKYFIAYRLMEEQRTLRNSAKNTIAIE